MIEIVENPCPEGWRDYCARHPSAQFAHLWEWATALAAVYDLPAFFLLARQTGMPASRAGLLPLVHFAPPDGPARLISLPYTDGAGILADDQAAGNQLLAAALDLAEKLDAPHLELRQYGQASFDPKIAEPTWLYHAHAFKVGLQRPLPAATAALWDGLAAKVRNQVRKAWRCGCVGRVGGMELLDDFYAVFSENMRDLGSPTHPENLFRRVLAEHRLGARCLVIYNQDLPVAAALVFTLGDTLGNPWAASLRRYRPLCPNMLLYWLMLCQGVRSGCRRFDFGRSSQGTATCRFKLQWGAMMTPLTWHVFSRPAHCWHPADETLVDEAWKSMDLAASRLQGPAIRRWISL
ncbi:GNAT family N-acetyltransferase [Desulfoprunum benzoelyticum]|uniref:FemAB-related protein (PEP-CTERM system-associated) n=1 Tax=Desulfoprunum benzoelyticum TaxID=1506996 RepID=A0A840UL42_9BACT|nr:GNAT family N-acetyltransferase [Desulfoprunum benzoelyticum]MBB5347037.1 FemAB-related protein (PEP-CTERM system-associated) [Desulfoprunum benzoelyticum]MBM9529731.1 GNAT family N-acetyltransferase [Desulfoprunum benzoelyticum]